VRRFLRNQLYAFTYFVIHFFFSIYIRLRQAYHGVRDRITAVMFYHHRTPTIIARDVKNLKRLPKHLSVILKLEESRPNGAELEKLVYDVSEIAAWCASAGVPFLSVYEKTGKHHAMASITERKLSPFLGILKNYIPETHRAVSSKLLDYFGVLHPSLTVQAPHVPPVESTIPMRAERFGVRDPGHLSLMLLSAEDGRDSLVDLTKTLAVMAQRSKISPADINMEVVDVSLTENVMGEPDLLLLFGPHVELDGYPPWQVRLTEIFHLPDNQGVGYQVFLRGLYKYGQAQMRFGR